MIARLANRGKDFTAKDKLDLKAKQLELIGMVLPAYREAAARGQIEISTTPFYHPILPLLCDSDIARVANPGTPLPRRAFRHPEDAREQLRRAKEYHERIFGTKPVGLWPSEGSVSDQSMAIAAEEGFRWFGTDEGVLGRTLNVGFFRDSSGIAANADRLYQPWRLQIGQHWHHRTLPRSPFVGLDWFRLQPHGRKAPRLRICTAGCVISENAVNTGKPLTVCLVPRWRKCLGILPGQRPAILARLLPSHQR